MVRDLTDLEIQQLLQKQCYGHLGCATDAKHPYIYPVTYAFHNRSIVCFSFEGKKVDMMRTQSRVCFQVEELSNAESWKSAMVWGEFEELTGKERSAAFTLLLERLWQETNKDHPLYFPFRNSARALEAAKNEENIVLFRINIDEQSGRTEVYEK